MPKRLSPIPVAVRRALIKLGADINAARRRRRLPIEVLAERALTTRQTIARIEAGDPKVAMGTWATVLFALGLSNRLTELAAPARDELGLALEEERLPTRIRLPTSSAPRTVSMRGSHQRLEDPGSEDPGSKESVADRAWMRETVAPVRPELPPAARPPGDPASRTRKAGPPPSQEDVP